MRALLDHAADLPEAVDRALAVVTGFQMLSDGELAGEDLFDCVLEVLRRENSPAVVEPFLNVALELAQRWTPQRPHRRAPPAGSPTSRRRSPTTPTSPHPRCAPWPRRRPRSDHLALLDERRRTPTSTSPGGSPTRRAALGRYDEAAVEALLERDPDPDAPMRALAVRTARPDAEAKDEAWTELFEKRNMPGGPMLGALIRAFWQPEQDAVLLPYADRFLDEIPRLAGGGMLMVFGLMFGMFPQVADERVPERARDMAADPDCDPTVRAALLIGIDTLTRRARARAA